jgi:hypothetical protein
VRNRIYPDFFTDADLEAYRGQRRDILQALAVNAPHWVPVKWLEDYSGTTRAAARINTLRDDWDIEMRRDPNGRRGQYRLIGRQSVRQLARTHCATCTCVSPEPVVFENQLEMKLG